MTIKEKINGRTCIVTLSGASLETLRRASSLFTDIDACWCGINQFDLVQTHILSPIHKHFDIVLDISEVENAIEYEKRCRIPRIKNELERKDMIYITSETLLSYGSLESGENIKIISDYLDISKVHNSLMAYLFLLTLGGAKDIYLFGCDGYQGEYIEHNAMMSYFCPEEVENDYRIAFPDKIKCALSSDTEAFNGSFKDKYLDFCTEKQVVPINIINVNPDSFIDIFKRINIGKAIVLLEESQNG
jgi:hypothetical protein